MTITLTPEQQAWIDALVVRGAYASREDAVRDLIDSAIAADETAADDFGWAKPLVEEALVASEHGDVLSLEEHRRRNRARLAAIRG